MVAVVHLIVTQYVQYIACAVQYDCIRQVSSYQSSRRIIALP